MTPDRPVVQPAKEAWRIESVRADEIESGQDIMQDDLVRGVHDVKLYVPSVGGRSFDFGDRWQRFEDAQPVWRVLPASPGGEEGREQIVEHRARNPATTCDNGWSFQAPCVCGFVASKLTVAEAEAEPATHLAVSESATAIPDGQPVGSSPAAEPSTSEPEPGVAMMKRVLASTGICPVCSHKAAHPAGGEEREAREALDPAVRQRIAASTLPEGPCIVCGALGMTKVADDGYLCIPHAIEFERSVAARAALAAPPVKEGEARE
jgi:hypothetical protein